MSAENAPEGEADDSSSASDKDFSCPECGESYDTQQALNSHVGHAHPGSADRTVECDYCGSEVTRTKGVLKNRENIFCNYTCQYNYRSESNEWSGENHPRYNQVEVDCSYCGTTLERDRSRVEKFDRQYCDSNCQGNHIVETGEYAGENNPVYNSRTITCEWCGGEFTVPVSVIEAGRRFCGIDCKSEYISEAYSGEDNWNYTDTLNPTTAAIGRRYVRKSENETTTSAKFAALQSPSMGGS